MSAFAVVLGAFLVSASAPSTQELGQPPFLHVRYPLGAARAVAAGDLDGDGDVDVAIARGAQVTLMRGSGQGWIESLQDLVVPADLVALGDLDGDSDADLVTASGDSAYVLLGDGAGGFSSPAAVRLGAPATDLMLADLDGDADLDLIAVCDAASGTGPSVRVLLGDGLGGFPTGSTVDLAATDYPPRGALGDLDEDGWIDLVVDPGQQLLLGDGLGHLVPASALNLASGRGGPCLADFDGDGHLDLLSGSDATQSLLLLLGDGQGGFPSSSLQVSSWPWTYEAGDLDGDGDVDVVCKTEFGLGLQDYSVELEAWSNDGSGNLTQVGSISAVSWTFGGRREIALADLDGNGDLDAVSASVYDVALLLGDGDGWFRLPPELPGIAAAFAEVGDLDGDGNADIVCSAGQPASVLGDGQGGFGPPHVTPVSSAGRMALADLDLDGILDLVVHDSVKAANVCLGDGTGRFPGVKSYSVGFQPISPVVADFDHDGDPDIAVPSSASWMPGIGLLLGNGSGGFVRRWIPVPAARYNDAVLGDLTGDGEVDIGAVSYFPQSLDVFAGDGQGGFGAPASHPLPGDMFSAAIGDLDEDGLEDVVVSQYMNAGVWVLWGQPGGGLGVPELIADSAGMLQPRDVALADVDGDGSAELMIAYEGNNHVGYPGGLAVLRRSGPREFTLAWTFGHGDGPWSIAVGDLDGDGRVDLVAGSMHVYYTDERTDWESPGPVCVLINQLPPEGACTGEVTYCVAKINSAGCLPRICSDGSPTLTGPDDFVLRAERELSHQAGLLIWGQAPATQPFQGGTLCVAPPLTRTPAQLSGGTPGAHDCSGTYAFAFTQAYMAASGLAAGTQVFAQFWSRDTYQLPPTTTGLTDALSFTLAP